MLKADEDSVTSLGYSAFLTVNEANELLNSLSEAISRAKPKHANHKARAKDC